MFIGNRIALAGILYSGYMHPIAREGCESEAFGVIRTPNNLGVVIKAIELSAFNNIVEKLFDLD